MQGLIARICLPLLLLLLAARFAFAADSDIGNNDNISNDRKISFSGFGTVGAAYSNTDQADIVRDLLQNNGVGHTRRLDFGIDSLLGVQLNASASDNLDGAVQVVTRRAQNNFDPELTWAYARYSPSDYLQLRAGRLGFDVYMLADSRNVGYSYQWVRPPIDFFGSLIISYFDGADLVFKYPLAGGFARAKLYSGIAREKISTGNADQFFSLDGSHLAGGHLEWQSEKWLFRLGYAQIQFHNEFPGIEPLIDGLRSPEVTAINPATANLADGLTFQGKTARYLSAGAAYDDGPLHAQLMLSRIKSNTLGYPDNAAGYFTLGYRIKKWTPYFTYSGARPKSTPRDVGLPAGVSPVLDQLSAGANQEMTAQLADQTTWSFGARYDLGEKMDLKLQLDDIHSRQNLFVRNNQPGWNGKARLLSIVVDFIF